MFLQTRDAEPDALVALKGKMLIAFEGGFAGDVCTLWFGAVVFLEHRRSFVFGE
jgi:hypothetical protein